MKCSCRMYLNRSGKISIGSLIECASVLQYLPQLDGVNSLQLLGPTSLDPILASFQKGKGPPLKELHGRCGRVFLILFKTMFGVSQKELDGKKR